MSIIANRRMVVQRLSIGSLLAATGCDVLGINRAMAPADLSEFVPWNDPSMQAQASRFPAPLHLPNWHELGHSLSPDGALLATPLPGDPVNQLAIIELSSRRAWRLAHPNYRVKLTQPTFSPDGQSIAFIVTPPDYYGVAEIWIAGTRGGDARVIASSPAHSYRNPTFSPDSAKLAYLKDVQAGPIPGGRQPVRREYRSGLPYALFEMNLETRSENRLAIQAWWSASCLAYSGRDDGFYLATSVPLRRFRRDIDGADMWDSQNSDSMQDRTGFDGCTGYFLPRGTDAPTSPASVIPDEIAGRGLPRAGRHRLTGVDRTNTLLIESRDSAPEGGSELNRVAQTWDGAHVRRIFERSDILSVYPRVSLDGSTFVAPVTSLRELAFLVRFSSRHIEQVQLRAVSFEQAPLPVHPADPSELSR